VIEKGSSSTTHSKPSTSQIEKLKQPEVKRIRESDVHGYDPEKGRVKVKERIPKKELQDISVDSKPKLAKKKVVEEDAVHGSARKSVDEGSSISKGSLKRKAKDDPEGVRNQKRCAVEEESYMNARKPSKPKTRDEECTASKPRASSKRKAEDLDDGDYEPVRQKKPRPERDSISSTLSSSRDETQRKEYVAPKKTGLETQIYDGGVLRGEKAASTSKFRKASPPSTKGNPMPVGRETDKRHSSTLSGTSSSKPTKLRRKSPIYTSTEDEKEDDTAWPVKSSTTPAANNATSSKAPMARNNSSQPLPSDDLRARYNTTSLEHLSVVQKLLVQKGRLDSLLKSGDLDSFGSISDSEGDVELLSPEELEVLTANRKRLHNELRAIWEAFNHRIKGEAD
jgi:RNA polymerase II elongation factor ELL